MASTGKICSTECSSPPRKTYASVLKENKPVINADCITAIPDSNIQDFLSEAHYPSLPEPSNRLLINTFLQKECKPHIYPTKKDLIQIIDLHKDIKHSVKVDNSRKSKNKSLPKSHTQKKIQVHRKFSLILNQRLLIVNVSKLLKISRFENSNLVQ